MFLGASRVNEGGAGSAGDARASGAWGPSRGPHVKLAPRAAEGLEEALDPGEGRGEIVLSQSHLGRAAEPAPQLVALHDGGFAVAALGQLADGERASVDHTLQRAHEQGDGFLAALGADVVVEGVEERLQRLLVLAPLDPADAQLV